MRHQLASEGPFDVTDKFRIDIYIDKKLVGRKQVLSTLVRRRLTTEVTILASFPGLLSPQCLSLAVLTLG